MTRPFMRQVADALMPKGAVWNPSFGGDFDNLLEGIAKNQQSVLDDLERLAHTRDPRRCPIELLPDLEREFGILPDTGMSEETRRSLLAAVKYKGASLPTAEKLQHVLDAAGFGKDGYGLVVTPNGPPPVDPVSIVDFSYSMTAHDFPSRYCAGNAAAHCGYSKGYYLVSGDWFVTQPVYPQAGEIHARAFNGSDSRSGTECAGYYTDTYAVNEEAEYNAPPEPYWPLVFFVGGPAARNPDGRIAAVAMVHIPAALRQALHRIILRIKPLGIWAALMVRYE